MTDETKLLTAGTVARMVYRARIEKRWSVYKLAYKSGLDTALIYKIEEGMSAPRIDTLQRICAALELKITFPLSF
jgi:transcriptional regulator with XRE-family HTH domain